VNPFLSRKPTLAIGHRGGAKLAPENTLFAFRQAVETFRCDALELDVQVTSDEQLVVWHDPDVDRMTEASGPVRSFTLAELRKQDVGYRFTLDGVTFPFRGKGIGVVTLEELLEAFPSVILNIELKAEAADQAEQFASIVKPHLSRLCIGSEQDAIAERLTTLLPEACHFYPRDALTQIVMALKTGEPPPEVPRYQVLDMPLYFAGMRLIDAGFLRAAEALGKWVNVWTVDEPAEMRQLRSERVGGIMTDRPDLLRAALDE